MEVKKLSFINYRKLITRECDVFKRSQNRLVKNHNNRFKHKHTRLNINVHTTQQLVIKETKFNRY